MFVSNNLVILLVVVLYCSVSMSMVFINKTLLSEIKLEAPFFITWFQCFITALYYYAYSKMKSHRRYTISKSIIKSTLPLAFVFTSMICLNNLCLKYVDISFYYIGRSLTTVFNVILTFVILREKTSILLCFCCIIIVSGFWLGIDQEQFLGSFSITGTIYGTLSSLVLAFYSIKTKQVLPALNNEVWLLSYYNNLFSFILFIPLIIINDEISNIYHYQEYNIYFIFLLFSSGICGLAISYVTTLLIKVTSPLTHNITGTAKSCAQTIIATYYYNQHRTILWWVSNYIVLIGSALYTTIRQREIERNKAKMALLTNA